MLLAQIVLNPAKDPSVIQVDVDLVNVLCTVRDQNGEFVGNLSKGDFQVKEDGKRQPISMFARQADTPLTVALLLDVSGSVQLILGSEKAAARRFFAEALRPGDRALLVGFAQLIAVWQDLTPSVDALQAALEKAGPFQRSDASTMGGTPRGGTLLYDAVKLVAEQKLLHLSGRKVMVVISDGIDQGSIASLSKAVQAA
ncbi:MAG TPA: VWA domain-containing protein, partial [Candidatus Sulfopaludibacter sp.]|nr:VWA domain-containing protein [Candidatus Sulfopaludibacter sp.]